MVKYPSYYNCGEGWFPLIDKMIEELNVVCEDFDVEINTIKEKFGTLRVYPNSAPEEVYKIINKYEEESSKICEDCGESGKIISSKEIGWTRTLCPKHYEESLARFKKFEE
jgi:hypothetical protein